MLIKLLFLALAAIGAMTAFKWVRQNMLSDGPNIANDNRDKVNRQSPPPPEPDEPEADDLLECKTCETYVTPSAHGNCPRCGGHLAG